jgi:alkylation response protein AidB-like acyl-CoA dehydrogenase
MIDSAAIVFTDVEVDPSWQVGEDDDMRTVLESVIDFGRCAVCAASLGMAEAAFKDAARWASTHRIRDRRLGEFQQIGLMLSSMATKVFNMRAHVYHTATLLDEGALPTYEIALMKGYVPRTAVEVADDAMQIFGGAGYTDDVRAARIWLDCRGNQYVTGTDQVMVNLASREILNTYRQ